MIGTITKIERNQKVAGHLHDLLTIDCENGTTKEIHTNERHTGFFNVGDKAEIKAAAGGRFKKIEYVRPVEN